MASEMSPPPAEQGINNVGTQVCTANVLISTSELGERETERRQDDHRYHIRIL